MLHNACYRSLGILSTIIVFAGMAYGGEKELEDEKFTPNLQPLLKVNKLTGDIKIDGDLTDSGWQNVARAVNFTQAEPVDMVKPSSRTEALITYDDSNLYIAIIAFDSDPVSIRSSLRDRDKITADDRVGIIIDTYGDESWAYGLFANPAGIQRDLRYTLSGSDENFDIIYRSEGKITAEGYQVEFAIPFVSLRFPDQPVQDWKITFWRIRPRESFEEYSWAAISKNDPNWLGQLGSLKGIENIQPGRSIEILPSFNGSQVSMKDVSIPNSSFHNEDINSDASVGIRYGLSSNASLEATINPDFSQVESDVAQIDVNTTFALFFPERRPFFQEGSDLFSSSIKIVHTRSINDPSFATKLTSRTDKVSYAYLGAVDERSPVIIPGEEGSVTIQNLGKSYSNIFRAKRSLRDDSYIGFFAIHRRIEGGGSGSNLSIDSNFRFKKMYNLQVQSVMSHTTEVNDTTLTPNDNQVQFDKAGHTIGMDGESFYGSATNVIVNRIARDWDFNFSYKQQSPTYRADNGFQRRNHSKQVTLLASHWFYPKDSIIDVLRPRIMLLKSWNYYGISKEHSHIHGMITAILKGQTTVYFDYGENPSTFGGVRFDDQWFSTFRVTSNFSNRLSGSFNMFRTRTFSRTDTPILADQTSVRYKLTLKPIDRLVIEPSLNSFNLKDVAGNELSDGFIFRTRTDYQFTKELFIRVVVQYNDFSRQLNIEPLLTYKINPFSMFFIGSTHRASDLNPTATFIQTDRQYFIKFQYLFRM